MAVTASAPCSSASPAAAAEEPLELMGLPVVVIEEWPDDRIVICSRRLALEIKAAMDRARAEDERRRSGSTGIRPADA